MKIGFIGLGIMGKPMVRNLLKAGHEVVAYDILPANVEIMVKDGVKAAPSAKAVAEECKLIITMLPNGPHVLAVCNGEDGILAGATPGSIFVDMSSIAPLVSQEIEKACGNV